MEIKLAESKDELIQILALQLENHYEHIPAAQKQTKGFVTVKHSLDLIIQMNKKAKQVIAVDNGQVVGYALVMLQDFKELIPVLIPMFNTIEKIKYKGRLLNEHQFYVMGQVCIKESHRGKGMFDELYLAHKAFYSSQFDLCVTEISTSNVASMKAHARVGFEVVHTFRDSTDEWNIVLWDWN